MLSPSVILRQLARFFQRRRTEEMPPVEIDGSAVLAKASADHWDYLVGHRTGVIILRCAELDRLGEWLHQKSIASVLLPGGRELLKGSFWFGRGIECRISEVAWVADCDS